MIWDMIWDMEYEILDIGYWMKTLDTPQDSHAMSRGLPGL